MLVERFQSVVKADYHQFHIAPLQSDSIPKTPCEALTPPIDIGTGAGSTPAPP